MKVVLFFFSTKYAKFFTFVLKMQNKNFILGEKVSVFLTICDNDFTFIDKMQKALQFLNEKNLKIVLLLLTKCDKRFNFLDKM